MTTYSVMRARIADEISDSNLTTQINRAIQSAIAHYERQRFYFNTRVTDTFALVADQEYYGSSDLAAIPNLLAIDDMYATISGSRYQIVPVSFDDIAAEQTGTLEADPPYRYAYHAQQIRMFPVPSAARTVTMADHYRLTALSADGDSNAWTTDAEELIRQRAKAIVRIDVEGHPGAIAEMQARSLAGKTTLNALEEAALLALRRETRLRRSIRELRMPAGLVPTYPSNITTG